MKNERIPFLADHLPSQVLERLGFTKTGEEPDSALALTFFRVWYDPAHTNGTTHAWDERGVSYEINQVVDLGPHGFRDTDFHDSPPH